MSDTRIQIDTAQIVAEIYTQNAKGVYYAKVSIPSVGLYVNSITIRDSPKYPEKGLWLQWPAFMAGSWIKPVEWSNDSQLKVLLEDAVWRALDAYNRERLIMPEGDISEKEISELFPT